MKRRQMVAHKQNQSNRHIYYYKAIQEQQDIIDAQQQELQKVKHQNDELIERIERLEQLILTRE